MVVLGYQLSAEWNSQLDSADLSSVGEAALLYDLFLGDVYFQVGDADYSAAWGWVPVLDFARGFWRTVGSLRESCSGEFQFTESEAAIRAKRRSGQVELTANYSSNRVELPYGDLLLAVKQFASKVYSEIAAQYPAVKSNPHFSRLASEVSSDL